MPGTGLPPRARIFVGLMAAIVSGVLVLIVLTLNRGFDFTDEGFVFSMIASNRSSDGEFWGFQHLLHPLWEVTGGSVLALRTLRLLGYVLLSVLLTLAASRILASVNVRLSRLSWVFVVLVAQIGTMAAWGYPPRYLGYNELSAMLAQLAGAIMLLLLAMSMQSGPPPRRRDALALWASLGAILVLIAFAKITSVVVIGVLLILVLVVARNPLRLRLSVVAVIGGMLLGTALLAASNVHVVDYGRQMFALLLDPGGQSESGYNVRVLLTSYAASVLRTIPPLIIPTILLVVVLFGARFGMSDMRPPVDPTHRSYGWTLARNGILIAAILLVISLLLPPQSGLWDGLGMEITVILLVALIAFVAVGSRIYTVSTPRPKTRIITISGLVVFLASPFAGALGTNNPIMGQLVFSTSLWAVGAGVALVLLWEHANASGILRAVPAIVAIALVANSGLWVVSDIFIHPYRSKPYFSQHSSTSWDLLRGISVTEADASLIKWIQSEAEKEGASGIPAITMGIPGALLAFNNSDWANPWTGDFSGPGITRACLADPPDTLFLLQPSSKVPGVGHYEAVVSGLAACGIDFPSSFEIVSTHEAEDPDRAMTLWRFQR